MVSRKFVSAMISCIFVMFICFLLDPSGFAILIGTFLFPILLFYGLPTSILSDLVTRKLKGVGRAGIAFAIHLAFAAIFVMAFAAVFVNALGDDLVSTNFILLFSLGAAFLFWSVDELLKLHDAKQERKTYRFK